MAKFKYAQSLEAGIDDFVGDLALDLYKNNSEAIWTDEITGAMIILHGKGFSSFETGSDFLFQGRINSAIIMDGDHELLVAVSGLNMKANRFLAHYDIETMALSLATGDDRVIGSKGGDILIGGNGDDVMTGRMGSDHFSFQVVEPEGATKAGPERDVITDFDTTGEDMDFLNINQGYEFRRAHKGADTRLSFEDGSTLLLKDVTKSEFETYLDLLPDV